MPSLGALDDWGDTKYTLAVTRPAEWLGLAWVLVVTSCSNSSETATDIDCNSEPIVQSTSDGVEFVRTPSRCFEGLPAFDYELKSVEIDGLRQGSDKPIDIAYYSYVGHADRLEKFIAVLGLQRITLFAQDWGSLIGLKVAGETPDWFARIVIGDGTLPVLPEGVEPYPRVENPDEIDPDLQPIFGAIPPQQPPFYDEDCNRILETG